ncbi:hypothetical protein [Providencia sp. Me31A]|uniref:hypothetical protein n=1 Tax=Providencia sp. Me31A TaxID=3392637 RepID=UPI003D2872FB
MEDKIKPAVIEKVIITNSKPSLEERVTALEKQLTDMQAAMSCESLSYVESDALKEVKKADGTIAYRIGMF